MKHYLKSHGVHPFRAQLPEYILDFGYIILGTIRTHIVKITNTSYFPVSFHADKRHLQNTGKGNPLFVSVSRPAHSENLSNSLPMHLYEYIKAK